MPRVTSQKAGKDYPEKGIKKGDIYYSWAHFRQPRQISKTPPRPSQLDATKYSGALAAIEALEDAIEHATNPTDLMDALSVAAEELDSVKSEFDEAIDSMEAVFPGGSPQIEDHTQKRDDIETCMNDIESAKDSIDSMDVSDFITEEAYAEGKTPTEFDDLKEADAASYMEAAAEFASSPSL
jgi:hypothetical protein